jgi:hypothetical protein
MPNTERAEPAGHASPRPSGGGTGCRVAGQMVLDRLSPVLQRVALRTTSPAGVPWHQPWFLLCSTPHTRSPPHPACDCHPVGTLLAFLPGTSRGCQRSYERRRAW